MVLQPLSLYPGSRGALRTSLPVSPMGHGCRIATIHGLGCAAGGHSIDSPEPIFGLVVAGLAHPDQIRANSTGRAGDVLVLTKPLGVGAMTTAIKKGLLDREGYKQAGRGCAGEGLLGKTAG
jgi:selenophosphate synthase